MLNQRNTFCIGLEGEGFQPEGNLLEALPNCANAIEETKDEQHGDVT
jgi:hypothetical protein